MPPDRTLPPGTTILKEDPPLSRRDALVRTGLGMLGGATLLAAGGAARSLFPRVHYTPPSAVVLGKPEAFAVGEVNERWKDTHKLVLVREEKGFYALRSVCIHLGCIPRWQQEQRTFRCPCHGSGFTMEGINFEGPAPRPLERLKITLDEDGQIVVDSHVRFYKERGQWDREGAFLAYSGGAPAASQVGG